MAALSMSGCVIVTPSSRANDWIRRIGEAGQAAGYRVVVGNQASLEGQDDVLFIAHDPRSAAQFPCDWSAMIATEIGSAVSTASSDFGMDLKHAAATVSTFMAGSTLMPRDTVFIDDEYLAGRSDITLGPNVVVQLPPRIEEEPDPVFEEALSIYRRGPPKPGVSARWGAELFTYHPSRAAERIRESSLETMGPARHLVFGPYIALPPGRWAAKAMFSVDTNAAEYHYRFEWGTTIEYAAETVVPGHQGIFELSLAYDWVDISQAELRIVLTQGSLGGTFEFLGMTLEKVS